MKPGAYRTNRMSITPLDRNTRLGSIIESSEDAIIGKDLDGVITDWNRGAERLYGYSADEVIGKSISMLVPAERSNDFPEILEKMRRGESLAHYETVRLKKDRSRVHISLSVSPIRDGTGNIIGASAIARDISERKRQEATLRESEERFRGMADIAPALIWTAGTDKLADYFNKTWLEFTGRSFEEEIGNGWENDVHPEDLQRCLVTFSDCFDRQEKFKLEYRLRRQDGEYRWIVDTAVPRLSRDGSFKGYVGIGVDVTDRRWVERERDLALERLRLAMKSGKCVGWDLDVKSGRDSWFGDLQAIFGMSSDTFIGRIEDFYHRVLPEDRERVAKAVHDAKRDRKPYAADFRVVRLDGSVRWLSADGKFYYAPNGEPERMLGMAIDITERKRVEEALRESEERLRLAAQAGKMFAFEWDVATDTIVRSSEAARVLGSTNEPTRLSRQQALATIHPEDRAGLVAEIANLTPQDPICNITYRWLLPNGSVTWLEKSARAFFDEQGNMVRMIGMVADVTDHKLAEEALSGVSRRLIEAQEQERSRIARELHDDVAQRLALVAIELQHFQQNPPSSPLEMSSRVEEFHKGIMEISDDVQALSHELHSSKLEYLGIIAAVKGFCREFGEQQNIEVKFESHELPTPLPVEVSLCLFRVLQEALHNAVKHSGVKRFVVRLWAASREIHLTVSDLGEGFDAGQAIRGRGLGLTSMKERLHLVKGELSIDSAPKHGTTIHARVPLMDEGDSTQAAS